MKRLLSYTLCLIMMLCCTLNVSAKNDLRQAQKELKAKIDKESKSSAKALKKEGWQIMPGALPLERQIMQSKLATLEEDKDNNRANIVASARSKGANFNAAKQMAQQQARTQLTNNISSDLRDIINDTLSNVNLGDDDYEIISTFFSTNESMSATILNDVVVVYEVYCESRRYVEVETSVYISKMNIVDQLRNNMRSSLDKTTQKLAKKLK